MKNMIFILLFNLITLGIKWQTVEYDLPILDNDDLRIEKTRIVVDLNSDKLEVFESTFDKVSLKHTHYKWSTSLEAIDTMFVITDETTNRLGIRILLCDNKYFEIEDPSKRNRIPNYLEESSRLNIQSWDIAKNSKEVNSVNKAINDLLPSREKCRKKRMLTMNPILHFSSLFERPREYYTYRDDIEMAHYNNQNELDKINDLLNSDINDCVGAVDSTYLIIVNYIVGIDGNIESVFFGCDCPDDLKSTVKSCMEATKWTPGTKDGKAIKISGSVLIGFNTDDRYKLLEEQSKLVREKPTMRDLDLKEVFGGLSTTDSEDVLLVSEVPPILLNTDLFDQIEQTIEVEDSAKKYNETIQFVVEKDGTISDIKLVRSKNIAVGNWLIKHMPKGKLFKPGKNRGRPVRVQYIKVFRN